MNNQKRYRELEFSEEFSEEPSSKQQVQKYETKNGAISNYYVSRINFMLGEFKKNNAIFQKIPVSLLDDIISSIGKICSNDLEQTRRLYPEYEHILDEIDEILFNGTDFEKNICCFIRKDNTGCLEKMLSYARDGYKVQYNNFLINVYFSTCIIYNSKNCFIKVLDSISQNNYSNTTGDRLLNIFFESVNKQNKTSNETIDILNILLKNNKLSFGYMNNCTQIFIKIVDNNLYDFIKPLKDNGFDKYDFKDLWLSLWDDPNNTKDIDSFLHYFEKDLGHINKKIDFFVESKFNNDNIVSNCLKYNSILDLKYDDSTNGKTISNTNTFERIMKAKFGLRKND